jgi:hypothetical protein
VDFQQKPLAAVDERSAVTFLDRDLRHLRLGHRDGELAEADPVQFGPRERAQRGAVAGADGVFDGEDEPRDKIVLRQGRLRHGRRPRCRNRHAQRCTP